MAEDEENKTKKVELTQVSTGSAVAFKLTNGDVVGTEELLVWMANKLDRIERGVA